VIIYAADDEALALELLEDAIKEAIPGVVPVCFQKPGELIAAAEKKTPDIVFLDISMPETNGIEVARQLNEISNGIKIVFVTGYSEYTSDAFNVYAFGYIMKPCRAKNIKTLIDKIEVPLKKSKDIVIKTFGNCEVYYQGTPVSIRSKMAKELLAYLVDREGTKVTRKEAAAILFGDDYSHSVQVSLTRVAQSLSDDLSEAGLDGFFFNDNGYYVNMSAADCDFIEYLNGSTTVPFTGEYMEQYSWGEDRKSAFTTW